jgi:GH35 family endo-1,4-beta-xylanase
MSPQDREKYRVRFFLENFNSAVTENALKWPSMEPRRGSVNYSVVDAMLQWTDEHQIPLRGHNIYWGVKDFVQKWVQDLPDDELREVLKNRGVDIGKRYAGRFAEYDLNNEMLHGNYYEQRLGKDITLQMARWVREGDPQAVLFLNDYDILTGARVDDYVRQIRVSSIRGRPSEASAHRGICTAIRSTRRFFAVRSINWLSSISPFVSRSSIFPASTPSFIETGL